ncbi:hypothetical protein DQ04_15981000 [Trypanosoma grayi]|uniref:hypothetical protein n=1 Tax=Trypanosoma grayi TaxID=71804 RepID=UPI0004F4273A|nr:hypothetical protein DQ04_15981000 [Trypanosoma grayi]KEG06093.1 hypothetical protein DQ04_15981000 [Trypanosoma grayi]
MAQKHYDCVTAKGMELEDESYGAYKSHSHWERRQAYGITQYQDQPRLAGAQYYPCRSLGCVLPRHQQVLPLKREREESPTLHAAAIKQEKDDVELPHLTKRTRTEASSPTDGQPKNEEAVHLPPEWRRETQMLSVFEMVRFY